MNDSSRALSCTALVLLAASAVACAPAGPDVGPVVELTSPAGPHSGEPRLAVDGDGIILSWLERTDENHHRLRMARLAGDAWGQTFEVAEGDDFFVNWADFPSVVPIGDGKLAAHWLQRGGAGGYDYGVRTSISTDAGATWSDTWTPHDDTSPTEHGFVSIFAGANDAGLVWLDGRDFASDDVKEGKRSPSMSLRYRAIGSPPGRSEEVLLDARVCDCCQTAAVATTKGVVVAYRDRSEGEIRDISVMRMENGSWTDPETVHDDGWHITGCPVNGPSLAADGDAVALAWFTGAGDEPRVRLAFSDDAGKTFGAPLPIDDGAPAGRVDVVILDGGDALVSWLERSEGRAEIKVRRVGADGYRGASVTLTPTSDARASGFPQLALDRDGRMILAWTDSSEPPQVRVGTATVPTR